MRSVALLLLLSSSVQATQVVSFERQVGGWPAFDFCPAQNKHAEKSRKELAQFELLEAAKLRCPAPQRAELVEGTLQAVALCASSFQAPFISVVAGRADFRCVSEQ